MAYYFYTLTFLFLAFSTILYLTRAIWKPLAPPIPYLTSPGTIPAWAVDLQDSVANRLTSARYTPLGSTFQDDAEAGLHSSNFNLAENVEGADARQGLDEAGKREVYVIMKRRGVGFDEARRILVEERFRSQGIGADGRPLDRKAVMFS